MRRLAHMRKKKPKLHKLAAKHAEAKPHMSVEAAIIAGALMAVDLAQRNYWLSGSDLVAELEKFTGAKPIQRIELQAGDADPLAELHKYLHRAK